MEAPTGLEPVYRGFAGRCLIQLDDGAIKNVAGAVGFEPTQHTGSKPAALPTRLRPNIKLGASTYPSKVQNCCSRLQY